MAACSQDDRELVGQCALASCGPAVDSEPQRVRERYGLDLLGQATEKLVAGSLVDVLSVLRAGRCSADVGSRHRTLFEDGASVVLPLVPPDAARPCAASPEVRMVANGV